MLVLQAAYHVVVWAGTSSWQLQIPAIACLLRSDNLRKLRVVNKKYEDKKQFSKCEEMVSCGGKKHTSHDNGLFVRVVKKKQNGIYVRIHVF